MGQPSNDTESQQPQQELYYFAYGPVVNDLVRKRRGIHVDEIRSAFLVDYRLTFAIGGMANIVPRRGYEVHGLLMKLTSQEDWEALIKFDAGSTPSYHRVIPYRYDDNTERREGDPRTESDPVNARFVEFSDKVEDEFLDSPIETLPQCRYLELIAQGMNQYGVDEDYIDAEIMATPFVPKCPPEEYQQVPLDFKLLAPPSKKIMARHSTTSAPTLPKISFCKYQKLCQKQPATGGDTYFIVDECIYRIHQVDIAKVPAAKWFHINGHGKPDCSLLLHKLIVDPDIPLCDHIYEMTPLHFAWVENRIVEQVIQKYQCQVTKVAMLKEEDDKQEHPHGRLRSVVARTSKRFSLTKRRGSTNPGA
ncbi:expressed unknown protein [Seminavis robusta]|uniref:Gamma-glutamylcyclotransferase AIG2-like domain-containing protein n=1 Tax=Seminavis robusta TaxID=568900 RepID=A0A9N8HNH3_9STRA|nr:expressed unknown protein [Seminavis robusta]CAB9521603.1 expressed unknown protein [Seminavis robusta]|eukprot:Sro1212_g252910.1 n/a (363) ;mRNA; f:16639-17727